MTEPKPKPTETLRTPKPKKKLGLTVPPALRLPHEDLITQKPEEPAAQEASTPSLTSHTIEMELGSMPSLTRHTKIEPVAKPPKETKESAISPQRDFTKVANSINRDAIPAGLFTGKSKQLYDCLYLLTRGAITPTRTIRISRPKLMEKANIGSRATFEANIEKLVGVGLIAVRSIVGEHSGSEYTVYTPDEIDTSMPSLTSLTSLTGYAQKLVRLVRPETSQTRHTSSVENKDTYDTPKTFFKTHDDDTHTAIECVRVLEQTAKEIVGGELPNNSTEQKRWRELGQLLADELRTAAQQAEPISSVPAFFTAHLRRRFTKRESSVASSAAGDQPRAAASAPEDKSRSKAESAKEKSRFSIEECLRYAKHLQETKQGITNPGGYATKIHRTGEADALIESFLDSTPVKPQLDASRCPDCNGTGFWYPEGFEKGAAKCKHEKLAAESSASEAASAAEKNE